MATLEHRLRTHVHNLAGVIGERNLACHAELEQARRYIEAELRNSGCRPVAQRYKADGRTVANIEVQIPGTEDSRRILVIGAHYDSPRHSAGANHNASGVAALLELARAFADHPQRRTLRFVAFTNEERPSYHTASMGSRVYARRCRERRDQIYAMMSLDGLGCPAKDEPVLTIAADLRSRRFAAPLAELLGRAPGVTAKLRSFPGIGAAVKSSDEWSFRREGYAGMLLTAGDPPRFRRSPAADVPEALDYDFLANVTRGIESALAGLASEAVEPARAGGLGGAWVRYAAGAALSVAGAVALLTFARDVPAAKPPEKEP